MCVADGVSLVFFFKQKTAYEMRISDWSSDVCSSDLAAELGLPYGFASHFASQMLDAALDMYRSRYRPSTQSERPYVLVGVNIVAAPSDDEARFLATSQQMSFADFLRSEPRLLQPPVDDIDSYWSPQEKAQASSMLACSIVGGPQTVRRSLLALRERTGADELMVVSDIFDPALRLRSFQLIAEAANSLADG